MFTLRIGQEQTMVTAQAPTLARALAFIADYCGCEYTVEGTWEHKTGRWVLAVYDWHELWCVAPVPLAHILAPPEFSPAPSPIPEKRSDVNRTGAGTDREVGQPVVPAPPR